jgi:hypothetical protein
VRWRQARRSSSRGENGRRRRSAPDELRVSSQRRRGSSVRGEVVVSFDLARGRVLGRPDRLGRVTAEAVSDRRGKAAREQAVRLGAQELRPAGPDPPRRRPEPRAAQRRCDGGGRDADPELEQLTLDADVAPARVLPPQTHDQATCLGRELRTPGPPATSPPSPRQLPVPAAKRPRAHRKARPPLGRQQTARSGQQRPVDAEYSGRFPPRLRIASWWRMTTASSSRSPPRRVSRPTSQHRSRYSKHITTTRSLNRPRRHHQHDRPGTNR